MRSNLQGGWTSGEQKMHLTRWLLCLTLVLAPLYVVRFRFAPVPLVGEYPTTLLEILILLTIFSWILEKGPSAIRHTIYEIRKNPSLILFLLAGIISIFVSPDRYGALGTFKAYIVEPLLIYFVVKDIAKDKDSRLVILYSLLFSALWLSILAIFQGLFGWFVVTPHEMAENRAHGVYNTANALGLYLGPLVMLAWGKLDHNKLKTRPLREFVGPIQCLDRFMDRTLAPFGAGQADHIFVHCCLVGLPVLAIIFSKSAGALFGLAVAAVFFVFSLKSRSGVGENGATKKFAQGLLVLTFLGTFLFVLFAVPRIVPPASTPPTRISDNTVTIRFCLWEGTRNMLLEKPLFGAGLSGFKETYKDFRTCDEELLEYPHNIFLNFWAEMGILSLISFLWICSRWIRKSSVVSRQLSVAFLAALVYILIHGLVDVPYFKNDLALEFWTLLALLESLTPPILTNIG